MKRALTWLRFCCAGFMPKLVEIGIDTLFAALRDNEHKALVDLMVSLLRRNAYSLEEFIEGVRTKTDQLEDLRQGPHSLHHLLMHAQEGGLCTYTLQCRLTLSLANILPMLAFLPMHI